MTGKYFEMLETDWAEAHVVKKCGDCAKFVNPRIEGNVIKGFCRVLEKIVWGMLTPKHNQDKLGMEITDECWARRFSWK